MGDLSVHVAKIARLRVPNVAVPVEVQPTMTRMAEVAEQMVKRLSAIIVGRDVAAAIEPAATTRTWTPCAVTGSSRCSPTTGPRRRGRGRRRLAGPVLRADRGPRRLRGQPGDLRGHRESPSRGLDLSSFCRPSVHVTHRSVLLADRSRCGSSTNGELHGWSRARAQAPRWPRVPRSSAAARARRSRQDLAETFYGFCVLGEEPLLGHLALRREEVGVHDPRDAEALPG